MVIENKRDRFILSRYMYRVGEPIISDSEYDALLEDITISIREGTDILGLSEYIARTYDDDPIPYDTLLRYGLNAVTPTVNGVDRSFLVEDKSMSIRKVDNMLEVFNFVQSFRDSRFMISIKMDGDNIKSEINDCALKLALTRGRDSAGFDVTSAIKNLMPEEIPIQTRHVIVGEVFVPEQYLQHLKETYDMNKYKTTRTAAMTMLRRPQDHKPEDLALMQYVIFNCDGLSATVSGTYNALDELGFDVPPFRTFDDPPQDYAQFSEFFEGLMDHMKKLQDERGLPADGLVLEVDSFDANSTVKNQYDSRQIAVKFKHWSSSIYTGIIKNVIMEQRKVYCCCKVEIEDVTTDDGCTASVINVHNPSHLLDKGLWVGDEIQFERQSGTINVLVTDK